MNTTQISQQHTLFSAFIQATRPRTFPLAMASIICGNGLAYFALNGFAGTHWLIFLLSLWVALCLQILSNLANDYGDGVSGVDALRDEASPERMIVAGQVDTVRFKQLIYYWAGFTFACGVLLIYLGFDNLKDFLVFLGFGVLAILAACAYTMGKRPYGYRAMGEVSVLIFFGWLGVLGSAYLQLNFVGSDMWLPATGCGLLSACVLYINNMRDIIGDKQAGKVTLAVLLGAERMVWGYYAIVGLALGCYLGYGLSIATGSLLWLILSPLLVKHLLFIHRNKKQPKQLGTQLKVVVLGTLVINVLFVVGLIF